MKRHDGPRLVRRVVHIDGSGDNLGVVNPDDVTSIFQAGRWDPCPLFRVTDFARRVVTPLAMATQTLAVVRALQARLTEIFTVCNEAVTRTARGHFPSRTVVMAYGAPCTHFAHFRVKFVREKHGAIEV